MDAQLGVMHLHIATHTVFLHSKTGSKACTAFSSHVTACRSSKIASYREGVLIYPTVFSVLFLALHRYTNTSAVISHISFIDGDKGILRYRYDSKHSSPRPFQSWHRPCPGPAQALQKAWPCPDTVAGSL